jgi:lipid II:glycine glycyltransferase (peptidoglycan interpeptide bridge formation enzyme)
VLPFKKHFVTELPQSPEQFLSSHHRRNARKALQHLNVEISENPSAHLDEWLSLYQNLIQRHAITDIRSFSRCSFEQQLKVPGIVLFRALRGQKTIGILLWYAQGDVAYYHLGAYDPAGYELNASFALFWTALEYFKSKNFQWLNLGAGTGLDDASEDGLTRFKRGWSNGTRTAYFCGRILDREAYAQLAQSTGNSSTNYFPAYRKGEFCKKEAAH